MTEFENELKERYLKNYRQEDIGLTGLGYTDNGVPFFAVFYCPKNEIEPEKYVTVRAKDLFDLIVDHARTKELTEEVAKSGPLSLANRAGEVLSNLKCAAIKERFYVFIDVL